MTVPWLTPNIKKLSWISLLTDISSEMLYPIMPLYMQQAGLNSTAIGLIEGMAEGIAAWGKGYFGSRSDAEGKRKIYIVAGYGLSTLAKFMLAISSFPILIYIARFADRTGKGIRSAPRDAVLAAESDKEHQGKVFGFHRSMDTIGAAVGPLFTIAVLYFLKLSYQEIFIYALVPGILGWLLTFAIAEKKQQGNTQIKPGFFSYFSYYNTSTSAYKRLMLPLLLFAIFNSSDFFLLLYLKHLHFDDLLIVGIYICYNFSYALFSYPAGKLADKIGFKGLLSFGMILFAGCYFGMVQTHNLYILITLFLIYGLYAALTDGIGKAYISTMIPNQEKASAFGFYNSCQAVATIIAGVWTGLVIDSIGFKYAFEISAIGAIFAAGFLFAIPSKK